MCNLSQPAMNCKPLPWWKYSFHFYFPPSLSLSLSLTRNEMERNTSSEQQSCAYRLRWISSKSCVTQVKLHNLTAMGGTWELINHLQHLLRQNRLCLSFSAGGFSSCHSVDGLMKSLVQISENQRQGPFGESQLMSASIKDETNWLRLISQYQLRYKFIQRDLLNHILSHSPSF